MAVLDRVFRVDARINRQGVPFFLRREDNVRSAIENRFATFGKSIPFLPQYGAILKQFQGATLNADVINRIKTEINTQILRDSRVQELKTLLINYNDQGQILIILEFLLVSSRDLSRVEIVI